MTSRVLSLGSSGGLGMDFLACLECAVFSDIGAGASRFGVYLVYVWPKYALFVIND